jgi:DNA-binding transcriptional LysR family regulator
MNFQQLRFVVAVAETRSFTSAADLCCVTQPALSNAIAQLEEELGGKLFERTTRAVTLSTFGAKIIGEIRGLIDAKSRLLVNSAEFVARNDRTVKIGMSPLINDAYVEAILARVATIDDSLTLVISEMNKNSIQPALEKGEIHFGLCPEPWAHNHLSFQRVYSEPLLYISNDPVVPGAAPTTLDTVSDKEILLVGDDCGLAATIRNLFKDNKVPMTEYEGRALGYNVLEKWAQLGIGVALLPASKIADVTMARRLNDASGAPVSINFHVCWKPSLEQRPTFSGVMKALMGDVS